VVRVGAAPWAPGSGHRIAGGCVCHTSGVAVDVFRPQSVGRAVRTAFVLGVLLVIGLVAGVGAYHQFNAMVGNNQKDELSRYLDDHQHSTAHPSGAGFEIDFPVPMEREAERVATGYGVVDGLRDNALVDDEVQFQLVWLTLPANAPTASANLVNVLISAQTRQLQGTRVALDPPGKLGRAVTRDFVFKNVDSNGTTRYYDERIIVDGHKVWIARVVSRVRRDDAFKQFAASFKFKS
jgi:hypothetical protein